MATTTLKALLQLLDEALGDYLTFATTTNITTNTSVISTALNAYDGGNDDYFGNGTTGFWLYIDGTANAGILRHVSDYATATGTLTVRGANLAAESAAVTCYLHRYNRDNKKRALSRALEQVYPMLYRPIDDLTLVTGNHLPDGSFEWWTSASAHKFLSTTNASVAKTTTDGLYRGQRGSTSMKVTVTAANGYAYLHSDSYPRLLDLMDMEVDFYCWAYPEVADDGAIVIYTKKADGTAQTLTSSTANPAGEFTKLELESQKLNDDLVELSVRFKVATNAKYVYFDDAVLCGKHLYEYLLPESLQTGHVSQAWAQTSGYSDEIMYDLSPRDWEGQEFRIVDDGTYRYLKFKNLLPNFRRIRLIGEKTLSALSADTDTIELDGRVLNLIIAKAASILYRLEQGPVSSEDKGRFYGEINMWEREYYKLLPSLRMLTPSNRIYLPER